MQGLYIHVRQEIKFIKIEGNFKGKQGQCFEHELIFYFLYFKYKSKYEIQGNMDIVNIQCLGWS